MFYAKEARKLTKSVLKIEKDKYEERVKAYFADDNDKVMSWLSSQIQIAAKHGLDEVYIISDSLFEVIFSWFRNKNYDVIYKTYKTYDDSFMYIPRPLFKQLTKNYDSLYKLVLNKLGYFSYYSCMHNRIKISW